MPKMIRGPAVALVLALMAGSGAYALPVRPAPAAPEPSGLLAPLWDWLSGLFAPITGSVLRATSAGAGSDMDPNGVVAPPPGDAGSDMDPNGLAGTLPGDAGSDMDPNG
jgi:hypothetical protein